MTFHNFLENTVFGSIIWKRRRKFPSDFSQFRKIMLILYKGNSRKSDFHDFGESIQMFCDQNSQEGQISRFREHHSNILRPEFSEKSDFHDFGKIIEMFCDQNSQKSQIFE